MTPHRLIYPQKDQFHDVLLQSIQRVADAFGGHLGDLHVHLRENLDQFPLRVVCEESGGGLKVNAHVHHHIVIEACAAQRDSWRPLEIHGGL